MQISNGGNTMLKRIRYALLTGLILVGGLLALPTNSVLAASNDMTITVQEEIPLYLDTTDRANPVFRGTGNIYLTSKEASSRQFVSVSIPDEFTIVAPDGEYTEDEGIEVNYFGSMNARKGYKNYEALNGLNGLSQSDISMGSIEVVIPLTKKLLSHGKGEYSVSIPITFTASEAYGSYNSNLDFTPWDEMVSSGDIEIISNEITNIRKKDEILEIDPSVSGITGSVFTNSTYKEVYIPSTVTELYKTFEESNVETVILGEGTTKVPDYFAYYDKNLKKVVLPSSIKEFGTLSFSGCESLEDISIPDEIKLGYGCFENCKSIKEFTLKPQMTLVNPNSERFSQFNGSGIERLIVEEGVTELPSYLCCNVENLNEVYLPTTLEKVGTCCISKAPNLHDLTIRSNLLRTSKNIVVPAFKDTGIERITFTDNVTKVSRYLFANGCSNVTELNLPDNITAIEDSAFLGCSSLNNITLPSSLTTIGSNAFKGCSSLNSLELPSSIKSVGIGAFQDATSLNELHINSTWSKGSSANVSTFEGSSIKDIYISDSVTSIGNMYLSNNSDEEMVLHVPKSVTKIGARVFMSGKSYSVEYEGTEAEYASITKDAGFEPVNVRCIDTPTNPDTSLISIDSNDTNSLIQDFIKETSVDEEENIEIIEEEETEEVIDEESNEELVDTTESITTSDDELIIDELEEVDEEEVIDTDSNSTNSEEILEVEVINNG